MIDIKWKNSIHKSLKSIADIEYQKKAWFGKSKYVSSFSETINVLYDDNCFEDFIRHSYWEDKHRENELLATLLELHDMISRYKEPKGDDKIIEDLKWISITKKAKNALQLWGDELYP